MRCETSGEYRLAKIRQFIEKKLFLLQLNMIRFFLWPWLKIWNTKWRNWIRKTDFLLVLLFTPYSFAQFQKLDPKFRFPISGVIYRILLIYHFNYLEFWKQRNMLIFFLRFLWDSLYIENLYVYQYKCSNLWRLVSTRQIGSYSSAVAYYVQQQKNRVIGLDRNNVNICSIFVLYGIMLHQVSLLLLILFISFIMWNLRLNIYTQYNSVLYRLLLTLSWV